MDDDIQQYLEKEGLTQLIAFSLDGGTAPSIFDPISGNLSRPLPPDLSDLVRLHKLIRSRLAFTVLEFGVGFSSLVIADALRKNELEWRANATRPTIRNRFMFRCFSVDASNDWIATARQRFTVELLPYVTFQQSGIQIGTFNGRLCHYYDNLPDVVPDFIYLDGPMAKDVRGAIHGISFQCDERTVMAGDLLLLEPTFLPGTFVLVDGRTNNARFLQRNFQRKYAVEWNAKGDFTTFELVEDRLGPINVLGMDTRSGPRVDQQTG